VLKSPWIPASLKMASSCAFQAFLLNSSVFILKSGVCLREELLRDKSVGNPLELLYASWEKRKTEKKLTPYIWSETTYIALSEGSILTQWTAIPLTCLGRLWTSRELKTSQESYWNRVELLGFVQWGLVQVVHDSICLLLDPIGTVFQLASFSDNNMKEDQWRKVVKVSWRVRKGLSHWRELLRAMTFSSFRKVLCKPLNFYRAYFARFGGRYSPAVLESVSLDWYSGSRPSQDSSMESLQLGCNNNTSLMKSANRYSTLSLAWRV
jgi:hypothetical protein